MPITKEQLIRILPGSAPVAAVFVPALNDAMALYQINTRKRIAAFLAQIGHESGQLTQCVENLNYSAKGLQTVWPKRFNEALANQVARQPQRIANIVYASRMGNGDTASGDGWTFRGRGLIQTTGKDNYTKAAKELRADLVTRPELLEQPKYAALSAAWFWGMKKLNVLADNDRFEDITRAINGGLTGHPERVKLWQTALKVLA